MYEDMKKQRESYTRCLERNKQRLEAEEKALAKMISLRDKDDDASFEPMYDRIIHDIEDRIIRITATIEHDLIMIKKFGG